MDLTPGAEAINEALECVIAEFTRLDPDGTRTAKIIRSTFDQLYDGQRTGRYRVDQLFKTEKTHFGTLVEINLQREFRFADGELLDYKICEQEVDCKFSLTGQWMLPPESFDQIIMVVVASDKDSTWSLGFIRVKEEYRRSSANRDKKTGLNQFGRTQIRWLFSSAPLHPNALLQLPAADVDTLMALTSGQQRINRLFRIAQKMRLSSATVATVAQQKDYMKRIRSNGGARSHLANDGIIILSGAYRNQRDIGVALGLEPLESDELMSAQLTPSTPGTGVNIGCGWWRLAKSGDPIVQAPSI